MEYIDKVVVKKVILDESKKQLGFNWLYQPVYDRVENMKPVDVIPIDWLLEKRDMWEEKAKDSETYAEWNRGLNAILILWEFEDKKKWKGWKNRG